MSLPVGGALLLLTSTLLKVRDELRGARAAPVGHAEDVL